MSDDVNIIYPNEKMLELMIIEEEKRRMSKEYADECTSVKDVPDGWLAVTDNMQKSVVKSFGFVNEMSCDIACNMMRRANIIYPDNKIFKEVPLYVRNNKANQGNLNVNDPMPDFLVYDIEQENKTHKLSDLVSSENKKMTVIFFGSHT